MKGISSSIYAVWPDPTNEKKLECAELYAGFYLNENPEALNYDAEKGLIKCAHNSSMGPAYRNFEKHYTVYRSHSGNPGLYPFTTFQVSRRSKT